MKTKILVVIVLSIVCFPIHVWSLEKKAVEKEESSVEHNGKKVAEEELLREKTIRQDIKTKQGDPQQVKEQKQGNKNEQQSQELHEDYTVKKNDVKEAEFYGIIPKETVYKLKGNLLLSGLPNILGNDSSISFKITKNKDDKAVKEKEVKAMWRVVVKIHDGNNRLPIMQIRSLMNELGSVLEEESRIMEYKGEKVSKSQTSTLTVSIEEQPFIGKGKVVRLKESKKDVSELMVGIDDPITTFMQIAVWASTIKAIPDQGLAFRWVMNGDPLPVILRELESSDKGTICYAVFRNISDTYTNKKSDKSPKPILKFTYPKQRKTFTMPNELELIIDSFNVVFKKETDKE